mgnify:CR=1 FL=1
MFLSRGETPDEAGRIEVGADFREQRAGAAVQGGVGTIGGAIIGGLIIGVLNNGMSIMGIGIDWQQVIKGAVLMLAVFLDVYYKNKG